VSRIRFSPAGVILLKLLVTETAVVSLAVVGSTVASLYFYRVNSNPFLLYGLLYGLLLSTLAVVGVIVALNTLLTSLWSTNLAHRLVVGGGMSGLAMFAVLFQWHLLKADHLLVFLGGTLLAFFAPAIGLRFVTKWRLRIGPAKPEHAEAGIRDLLFLTAVFALAVVCVRQFVNDQIGPVTDNAVNWLLSVCNALPAAVVFCLTTYCCLRAMQPPWCWRWSLAGAACSVSGAAVLDVQLLTLGFTDWTWEMTTAFPSLWGVTLSIFVSLNLALFLTPWIVAWPLRHAIVPDASPRSLERVDRSHPINEPP